tara:strand:+ start:13 stop:204 length:192 start_codon:yes stop_codon:yes gene_type:complete
MAKEGKHQRKDLGVVSCVEGLAVGSGSFGRGFSAKFRRNHRGSRSDFFGLEKCGGAASGDPKK